MISASWEVGESIAASGVGYAFWTVASIIPSGAEDRRHRVTTFKFRRQGIRV